MASGKTTVKRILWVVIGFALAAMLGLSFEFFVPQAEAQTSVTTESADQIRPIESEESYRFMMAYQDSFRRVAQTVLPVVVKIDVVDVVERTVSPSPFRFFFGQRNQETEPETREYRQPGLGSGVMVRRAGNKVYVLTNEHVVGDADEITVNLHDGREFDATLVGKDRNRDLALVVFETRQDVPIASLGDSDELMVGDWAFAVGNPLGYESTLTAGIISAVGRRAAPGSTAAFTDYIQTDAAINQGNSGGALVNLAGEVVGINTWIASQSGGSIGLGFAIPINNAKRVIDQFIAYGEVEYGWLGVRYGGPISEELADSLNLRDDRGAFVGSVLTDSPADRAGILPGDIITEIDGDRVDDWDELLNIVVDLPPGQSAQFDLIRENRSREVTVRIARRTDETQNAESWPGFTVVPLTDEIRDGLGLRNESGDVVVAVVDSGGPAAIAGIRQGDIIRRVGNRNVDDVAEFYRLINGETDDELSLRIAREGREFVIGLVR